MPLELIDFCGSSESNKGLLKELIEREGMAARSSSRMKDSLSRKKGYVAGYHGYCTSDKCCMKVIGRTSKKLPIRKRFTEVLLKDVPRGTRECPDCSASLRWE